MSKTLLNYFKKADNAGKSPLSSPAAAIKKEKPVLSPKVDKENARPKEEPEKMDTDIYDDEEIVRPKAKRSIEATDSPRIKRKRLMIASDSDSEAEPKTKSKKKAESSPEFEAKSEPESEGEDSFICDDDDSKPKKKNLTSKSVNSPKTPKSRQTKSKIIKSHNYLIGRKQSLSSKTFNFK